jgi:hypothetical protein
MATVATKLKIAKTKPAPHKILPVEYRCVHFWNSSTTNAFQTAILPLVGGIFFGAKSTRAEKPFLCHFFTAVSGGAGNREPQLLAEQRPKFRRNLNRLMGYRARQIVLSTASNSRWFQTPQSFCRWLFAQPSTFNPQLSTI